MSTSRTILRKARAIARRSIPVARNLLYSRLGIWPVHSMANHWIAEMPTYCISLRRSMHRRATIARQVTAMELRRFAFVDAVDSALLSREELIRSGRYDPNRCLEFHSRELTINEIACSLSHAEVYAKAMADGNAWTLILEDDALFLTRRLARVSWQDVPADRDIIFLNAFMSDMPSSGRLSPYAFDDSGYLGSSAAYLVSFEAARKLLSEALPVVHAADGLLGRVLGCPEGVTHSFRQRGVSTQLRAAILCPEVVLNGSVEYYVGTSILGRN